MHGDVSHRCHANTKEVGLKEKWERKCGDCDGEYVEQVSQPFYLRYESLAVVGDCDKHGLFFKNPSPNDLSIADSANDSRNYDWIRDEDSFIVSSGPKSNALRNRNISSYLDLFTSRQILYLESAASHLSSFSDQIRSNLGLLISTSTEFNSILCGYKGGAPSRPGAIRHVFSHHAYSFPHTAVENNPIYPKKRSGTLLNLFNTRIKKARLWAVKPKERKVVDGRSNGFSTIQGEVDFGTEVDSFSELEDGQRRFIVRQGSSSNLPLPRQSIDHVVTDPPYFDNVQYGNLSEFFRVWLREFFPKALNWSYDVSQAAVDSGTNGAKYQEVLGDIFAECNRVLKRPNGRLIFTFHHWRASAWAALTSALSFAGFYLTNTYILHSENSASVHISNLNALEHDAVLILQPSVLGLERVWKETRSLDRSDSRTFTQDCAAALGWILSNDLRTDEIEDIWKRLLLESA